MYNKLMLTAVQAFLLSFVELSEASNDHLQIDRVRGIALQMKAFYDPGKDFQCLDGSMRLPFSYVNDDYCDCPDGSDEPGTSACPRGNFHCVNLMHASLEIPSSRVNDGICDCCDGSDEYASEASCPNTCEFLGRAAREEAKRREELINQGSKLRSDLIHEGKQRVAEANQKVDELKQKVEQARMEKEAKDARRKEAEDAERAQLDAEAKAKEEAQPIKEPDTLAEQDKFNKILEEDRFVADEAFHDIDTNEDGVVTFNEVQSYLQFDQNRDGVVTPDEAKFFLAYREEVDIDEFAAIAWPLIKPVWSVDGHAPSFPPREKSEDSEMVNGEDYHDDDDDDDEVEQPPKPLSSALNQERDEKSERDPVVAAAVEAADKARMEYHDADRLHKDLEQELEKYENIATGDFGTDQEFAPLRGECYELVVKEYIYKMCPFDKCSQRSKDGGQETSLGRWSSWVPSVQHKYSAMLFSGGTGCWNGPARSTMVVLQCGLSNQLVSAFEPSRCEYRFEFATPAACVGGMPVAANVSPTGTEHDEL